MTKDIGTYIHSTFCHWLNCFANDPEVTKWFIVLELSAGELSFRNWLLVSMFSKVSKVENVETLQLFKWQNSWRRTNIKSAVQTLNMKFVLSGQVFKDSYHKPVFCIVKYHNQNSRVGNLSLWIREHLPKKKCFLSGIARIGGGAYPCPNFLAPFFYQVIVLRIAFFTQTSQ